MPISSPTTSPISTATASACARASARCFRREVRLVDNARRDARGLARQPRAGRRIAPVGRDESRRRPRLRVVQKFGSRRATSTPPPARHSGIKVLTIRRRANIACAEVAFALMLTLAKKLHRAGRTASASSSSPRSATPTSRSTAGTRRIRTGRASPACACSTRSTLGIIGLGEIGREIAIRAAAFGMRILYYQRTRLPEAEERELQATYVPLETLLAQSDWVVPQLPSGPATRAFIDRAQFAQMKPGAFLVNVSRADVVDRAALIEALQIGPARRLRARSALRGARPQRRRALGFRQRRALSAHRGAAALQRARRSRRHDGRSVERGSSRHEQGLSFPSSTAAPRCCASRTSRSGEPGPGQVRMRNLAVAVNYRDVLMRRGVHAVKSFPSGIGLESAGVDRRGRARRARAFGRRPRRLCRHAGRLVCRTAHRPGRAAHPAARRASTSARPPR